MILKPTEQVTISYGIEPIPMEVNNVTIHYPLPSGKRHLGGRLQRKARLRKKQNKYRLQNGYSFCMPAYVEKSELVDIDGVTHQEFTFCLKPK